MKTIEQLVAGHPLMNSENIRHGGTQVQSAGTAPDQANPAPTQEAGTPETDAESGHAISEKLFGQAIAGEAVTADFARSLERDRDRLRSSLATAERERDLFRGVATLSNDSETKEIAETVAQFIAVHEQLKADLAAAQKERDDLIAQLHVIFTELKKIPCLQGEGPRKGA